MCAGEFESVRDEMAEIMESHQILNNQKMADKLFDYLSEKYDTDYWLVVVYDGIEGRHSHWQLGYYHHVSKQGEKNALAVSRNKLSKKYQEIQINSLKRVKSFIEAVRMSCENDQCNVYDAHQLVDHLSRNYVLAESTLFAIDNSANVVKRVDTEFVPYFWHTLHTEAKTFVVVAIQNDYSKTKSKTFDLRSQKDLNDRSGCSQLQSSLISLFVATCILRINL